MYEKIFKHEGATYRWRGWVLYVKVVRGGDGAIAFSQVPYGCEMYERLKKLRKKNMLETIAPSIPASDKREALWRKIIAHTASPDPVTGCWEWQKGTSGNGRGGGYGRVYFDGQMIAVHRAVYLIVHGYLHKRQQVDHTCNNRLCVNPDHLEAVSASENMKRAHRRKSQKCKT